MNRLPHLDKTEEDQPGHYPYIAYKKGISSLFVTGYDSKKAPFTAERRFLTL